MTGRRPRRVWAGAGAGARFLAVEAMEEAENFFLSSPGAVALSSHRSRHNPKGNAPTIERFCNNKKSIKIFMTI